jgi:hypothetical protein
MIVTLPRLALCTILVLAKLELVEAEDAAPTAEPLLRTSEARAKRPVPSTTEQRAALARVLEIFGDDIRAAKSPEAKAIVAEKLIHCLDEGAEPATHYALLETVRRLAIEACDIRLAHDAGQRLTNAYHINFLAEESDALLAIAAKAPVARLGPIIDELVEASSRNLPSAPSRSEELALAATSAARRAKDRERGIAATQALAEAREARKREIRAETLLNQLKESPEDGAAALKLGMLYCFEEQNWADGLQYLARGDDMALKLAAKQDIGAQSDPSRRLAAADAWWDYGKAQKGGASAVALQRARLHYAVALENAKGLDRARIEKQLKELDADLTQKQPLSAWTPKNLPGMTWWLDASDAATVKLTAGAVTRWVDKSGKGCSFVQPVAKRCPAYAGEINGRKTIAFDGIDDYLLFAARNEELCDKTGAAIFVVFKPEDDSDFSIFGISAPTLNNQGRDLSADGKTYHCYFRQARMIGLEGVLSPASRTLLTSRTQATGEQTLRINGRVVQSQSTDFTAWRTSAGENPGDASNKVHTIGVNLAPANYFKGQIAEAIMYGRRLSDQEVDAVERYLKTKWGSARDSD